MLSAGLFAALGILPNIANAAPASDCFTPLEPFLLPPAPPLSHNGRMDIKVWVRSHMTGGVFSCVECAVAPKVMGPPPHFHKELDELMFVLEGTASVMVEGQEVQVPAGGWQSIITRRRCSTVKAKWSGEGHLVFFAIKCPCWREIHLSRFLFGGFYPHSQLPDRPLLTAPSAPPAAGYPAPKRRS